MEGFLVDPLVVGIQEVDLLEEATQVVGRLEEDSPEEGTPADPQEEVTPEEEVDLPLPDLLADRRPEASQEEAEAPLDPLDGAEASTGGTRTLISLPS